MPARHGQHFIIDADALIDYCNSDLNVLSTFSQNIRPIHVGRGTFVKVNCLSEKEAAIHHLLIETPDLNTVFNAGQKRGALLYDDHETLLLAKKTNGFALQTTRHYGKNAK